MKIITRILLITFLFSLFSSCAVSTKRMHTASYLECYGEKVLDIRKKYSNREKNLDKKSKKYIRRIERTRK